jgi:hypothetical protein
MSMNLHARIDKHEIDLWQTPTQITYMCLIDNNGKKVSELKGKQAKRALAVYMAWVEGSINGAWESHEAMKDHEENIESHIAYLHSILKKAKRIYVYVL